jgi:hypothetical protein
MAVALVAKSGGFDQRVEALLSRILVGSPDPLHKSRQSCPKINIRPTGIRSLGKVEAVMTW